MTAQSGEYSALLCIPLDDKTSQAPSEDMCQNSFHTEMLYSASKIDDRGDGVVINFVSSHVACTKLLSNLLASANGA